MENLRNEVSWSGDFCCQFLGVENLRNEFLGVENLRNEFLGVEISVASFFEWRISVMRFLEWRFLLPVSWSGESP